MRGSYIKQLLIGAAVATGLAGSLSTNAQIAVTSSGSALFDFTAAPPTPSSFSSLSVAGAGTSNEAAAGFDALLVALTAAGINTPLATVTAPGTHAQSAWDSGTGKLETDPTGVLYGVLMATMVNNAGSTITEFKVTYDYSINNMTASAGIELIPGHRVFFSTTGLANDWQPVPSLTGINATPGANATITGISWSPGTMAYIMWGDDNSGPNPDRINEIDNLIISDVVSGPMLPPSIGTQPVNTTVNERQVARLTVAATGANLTYQWYIAPSTAIPGATSASYNVTNRMGGSRYPWSNPMDNGTYYVIVTGSVAPPAESTHVTVTVTPDTTAPSLVRAFCGGPNPDDFTVTLSEPLNNAGGEVTDQFLWEIQTIDGSGLPLALSADATYVDDGTSTTIIMNAPGRDMTKGYKVVRLAGTLAVDTAKSPNSLPALASAAALCFTNEIVAYNHAWHYNDLDVDPGATWKDVIFDDSSSPWALGTGPFDSKRDGGTVGPDGLDDCRPMTLYSLGAVGTCLREQSPVTLTNLATAYFRTHFTFPGNPADSFIHVHGKVDDGAIFYLNGTEIGRLRVAAGTIPHASFSGNATTVGDTDPQDVFDFPNLAPLVSGDNVLAVELKQGNLTSSDLTMGLSVSYLTAEPPITLTIVDNGNGTVTVSWNPAVGTLRTSTSITAPRSSWAIAGVLSPQTVVKTGTQQYFIISVP